MDNFSDSGAEDDIRPFSVTDEMIEKLEALAAKVTQRQNLASGTKAFQSNSNNLRNICDSNSSTMKVDRSCPIHGNDYLLSCPIHGKLSYRDAEVQTEISMASDLPPSKFDMAHHAGGPGNDNILSIQKLTSNQPMMRGFNVGCKVVVQEDTEIPDNFATKNPVIKGLNVGCELEILGKSNESGLSSMTSQTSKVGSGLESIPTNIYSPALKTRVKMKKGAEKKTIPYDEKPEKTRFQSSILKVKKGKSYSPEQVRDDIPLVNFIRHSLTKQHIGELTGNAKLNPRTSDKIETLLSWSDIKLTEEVLGKGQFGVVVKGTIIIQGKSELAAIKTMQIKNDSKALDALEEMWKELNVMTRIGAHPNVVRLFGACENDGHLYVAMEFLPRGDLKKYLRKETAITYEQKLKFCYDIASGMEHIASRGFIHRDLAARNILLTEELSAKVSDFGLSRFGEEYMCKSKNKPLPVRWMPPESILRGIYTEKSDVWSYGVTIWEIFTGCEIPYRHKADRSQIIAYIKDGSRLKQPLTCPDRVYTCMKRCWATEPSDRPSFSEIKDIFNALIVQTRKSVPEQLPKGSGSKMSETNYPPIVCKSNEYWDIPYDKLNFPINTGAKLELQGKDLIVGIQKLRQNANPVSALCVFYSSLDERDSNVIELDKLKNEVNILKTIFSASPNILRLLGTSEHAGIYYAFFEHPTLGRLKTFLTQRASKKETIEERVKVKFCSGICQALRFLAGYKIIHRDVSAKNVFLTKDLCPKLGGFRNARRGETYIPANLPKQNPVRWMALESIREKVFTQKSDVWSFGIVCWEIWSDCVSLPFEGKPLPELIKDLEKGEKLAKPASCPDALWAIVIKCWALNPHDRPTFKELMVDFEGLNKAYTPIRSWYIALKEKGIVFDASQKSLINSLKSLIKIYDCFHDRAADYWTIKDKFLSIEDRTLYLDKFQRITPGQLCRELPGQKITVPATVRNILIAGLEDKQFWDQVVIKELDMLKFIPRHKNILQLYGTCKLKDKYYIVEEWAEMGELKTLLVNASLTEATKMLIIFGICEGMEHLAKYGIIHRDLGTRSIKIAHGFVPKITKFKSAQKGGIYFESDKTISEPLPIRWLAPENLTLNIYTERSDVWSFGILIWETFSDAQKPYGDKSPEMVIEFLQKGERLERPPKCPPELYALMSRMWNADITQRPTFASLTLLIRALIPKEEGKDSELDTRVASEQNTAGDIFLIPKSKIEILSRVRRGDESGKDELWLGRYELKKVIVRLLKIGDDVDADHVILNNAYNEINIMKLICPHPRIVNFIGYFKDSDKMHMIKDFYPNGDLKTYLRDIKLRGNVPKPESFLLLSLHICEGMSYLVSKNVIHRNFSLKCISLDENFDPRIDEFNRAVLGPSYAELVPNIKNLPFRWLPLESIQGDMVYTEKSDVWSFGITMWEMFSFGAQPYGDIADLKDIIKKLETGFILPSPKLCPESVYKLITSCCARNKDDRPTFAQLQGSLRKLVEMHGVDEQKLLKNFSLMSKESGKKPEEYWVIPWDDINLSVKQLGKGNFGQVNKGTLKKHDGTKVKAAIKMIKAGDESKDVKAARAIQELKDEAEIMKILGRHRHVIQLYGYSMNKGIFYVAMEYAENGNLKNFIEMRKNTGKMLLESNMIAFAAQICDGMDHLARCQVIHRDLACRNILLDYRYECKISDFGLARIGTIYVKQSSGSQLPVRWMAMECFTKKMYSEKTDVWAFGVLMWELYSYGRQPYEGKTGKKIMESLENGIRLIRPPMCCELAYEIMRRCWEADPDNRKSFAGIGIDLNILIKKLPPPQNLVKKPWYRLPFLNRCKKA